MLILYAVLAVAFFGVTGGETLYEMMAANTELSEMVKWISPEMRDDLNTTTLELTVFAPNNGAFNNVEVDNDTIVNTMKYHIVTSNITKSMMTDEVSKESNATGTPKLWFSSKDTQSYVNGRKIVTPDLMAENGYLHIIESVLSPIGSTDTIKGYIQNEYRNFSKIVDAAGDIGGILDNATKTLTLFAPVDAAITESMANIAGRHIIDGKVLFRERLMTGDYAALNGSIKALYMETIQYVSSGGLWVTVTGVEGQVTSNGVVHKVDGVLGSTTTVKLLEVMGLSDLGMTKAKFTASASIKSELEKMDQTYTMFAPDDNAWKDSTAADEGEKILKRHIVKTRLEKSGITGELTTMSGEKLMAKTENNKVYIEIDGVKAEVTKFDQSAANGIIHVINKVLSAAPGVNLSWMIVLLSMLVSVVIQM